MSEWISVNERLPETDTALGFITGWGVMRCTFWKILGGGHQWLVFCPADGLMILGKNNDAVTHWMPLPEPPK